MFVQEGETKDQTFTLASMKIHERYDDVTFENDIAILKLNGVATRLYNWVGIKAKSQKAKYVDKFTFQ